MDIYSSRQRSRLMSLVRSNGNASTELRLVALFRSEGITGWRRGYPLFGKPDFVFPKRRLVVFVDGCFWHGCPIHGTLPQSNQAFWQAKLTANVARDRLVTRTWLAGSTHLASRSETAKSGTLSVENTQNARSVPLIARCKAQFARSKGHLARIQAPADTRPRGACHGVRVNSHAPRRGLQGAAPASHRERFG